MEVKNSFSQLLILLVLCLGVTMEALLSARCRPNEGFRLMGGLLLALWFFSTSTKICNLEYTVNLDWAVLGVSAHVGAAVAE